MPSLHRLYSIAALVALLSAVAPMPAWAEEATFTDGAYDAYRVPGSTGSPDATQPPNPLVSDAKADIIAAGFANVSGARGGPNHRSYTATMTITGTPDPTYSYVVAGAFGTDCQLYHFLTPGITSFANAFCGSDDTPRFVGRITGGAVQLSGSTLTATYTYMVKKLPPELSADPQLGPLFAFSCVSDLEGLGCQPQETLDYAEAPPGTTFTI